MFIEMVALKFILGVIVKAWQISSSFCCSLKVFCEKLKFCSLSIYQGLIQKEKVDNNADADKSAQFSIRAKKIVAQGWSQILVMGSK